MSLPTAIELAANAPEREPSDQELLAGYQPSFPHPIDLNSEVAYGGEMLRYKDAVAKERAAFIARKRKAIQDKREREERARIAKIEAAEKQQAFEAASKRGEARAALKDALAAYQQLREQTHTLESTLIEARAHEAFLRTDAADPGNDKFGRTLGAARDATGLQNLTQDVASCLVHFGPDTTQTWLLVRLKQPEMPNAPKSASEETKES